MLYKNMRIPFQNMTKEGWINLGLTATLTFYIILIGFFTITNQLCGSLAFDYCAFWAGGKVANDYTLTQVYNLEILKEYQIDNYPQDVIDRVDDSSTSILAVPLPYLPIFILPFKLLSLIDLPYSYFIWALMNLVGLILYLQFFSKKVAGHSPSLRMLLLVGISLPVFINFLEGQLNVWLAICAGEFIRAAISKKPIKAGLWLGGWLLKPQLLILILPCLLIRRQFKALFGFILSSVGLFFVSYLMIGINGFVDLTRILMESAGGGALSNPTAMINWRMLGILVETITTPILGWAVIIIGSLLTTGLALYFLCKRMNWRSDNLVIAILGIFAATCVVAWHVHLHTSMILIPPIFFLLNKDRISNRIFYAWLFIPILVYFLGYAFAILVAHNISLTLIRSLIYFAYGLSGFVVNLILFRYAIFECSRDGV